MSVTANLPTPPASKTYAFRFADDSRADIQLATGRFTIGAGDDCSLRLPEPGGRPIQSLVVVGPGGAIIRNMRPDALLNGNFFREAMLQPGDRLNYGDTEFAFVQQGADPRLSAREASVSTNYSSAALHEAAAQISRLRDELQQTRAELTTARQQAESATSESNNRQAIEAELTAAREQLAKERAEAEAMLRAERDRLEQEAAELQAEKAALASIPVVPEHDPLQDREAKIAQREQQLADAVAREQAELDSRREQLERDRERLEQERELARMEIEEERRAAAVIGGDVVEPSSVDVFAPEPASPAVESPSVTVEESIDEQPAEASPGSETHHEVSAESKSESARAAEEALARIQAAGIFKDTAESLEVESHVNETPADAIPATQSQADETPVVESSTFEIEAPPLQEREASLQQEIDEPPQHEIEESPVEEAEPAKPLGDAAPVSFIDQYAGAFDEDDEEAFTPVEPVSAPAPEPVHEPQNVDEDDHESSIEDYMAQLMQRMQGGPAAAKSAPTKPQPTSRSAEKVEKPKAEKPVEEPQEVLQASEYKPRSSAPEQTSNLAAMRDLANQTARSAIKTSSSKMRWAYAGARIGMALFFFGVGAVMLYMTNSLFGPMFLGSLVTIIGGGVLCYQAAQVIAGKDPNAVKRQQQKRRRSDQFEEEEEE